MNAVVYARYSSHRQGEQSIEGQLAEAQKYAAAHDLTIICQRQLKMSIFAEKECHFSPDSIQVYTALHHPALVGLKPVKP